MPNCLTDAFFDPDLQWQRLNTHQYSENDNVQTTSKMDNLHLADFVELQLKSTNDFDAAYDIVMNAGWGDYMLRFVAIQPGDRPCQFYCHQIIYHCLKKFISFTPMCAQVNQEHSLHDHSTYSYPSITGSDKEESLEVKLTSQPRILSVIPTVIGPLHISLFGQWRHNLMR